jgi:Xaa-Pro dipeptidase
MNTAHLQYVLANLKAAGLSQVIISDPDSIYYLTGFDCAPGERLLAFLVKTDGTARLFCNHMFPVPADIDSKLYDDADDSLGMLARDLDAGKCGIDKTLRASFLLGLMDKRPDVQPVLGSAPVDDARMCKDAEELEKMRYASNLNDATMDEILKNFPRDKTEAEVSRIISDVHMRRGTDYPGEYIVCYGVTGGEPHHVSDGHRLHKGDSITLDVFAPVNHYWCDMTRTVFYGSVSDEQRKVYEAVKAANEAGIAAVRPGVKMKDIDRAARKVIEDAGYGKYFTHRLGHGIGLACHEFPDCSGVCETITRPGMCFSIEPGIYLPGKFGVRIEDLVTVTEDGVEVFNHYSKDLIILPE